MILDGDVQAAGDCPEDRQTAVAQPYLPPGWLGDRREAVGGIGEQRPRRAQADVLDPRHKVLVFGGALRGLFVAVGFHLGTEEVGRGFRHEDRGRDHLVAGGERPDRDQLDGLGPVL